MTEGRASAGARGEDRCGHTTTNDEPCELPPSRPDDRCHLHTEVDEQSSSSHGDTGDLNDYEVMLETLDTAIGKMRRKIEDGRIRDAENEKVRVKQIRALVRAVDVRRKVTNDRDLQELAEEIEELKEMYGEGEDQ